ncbi:MAG: terminase family protein [Caenibius sp.]
MTRQERLRWLLSLEPRKRIALLATLSPAEREELRWHWALWSRPEQRAPSGDWRIWLICAGRGFGKTRAGAEWVRAIACRDPNARIALVGASLGEARSVMIEGESGILACSPPRRRPHYEPSLRRLTWPNGAQAFTYSAAEPESLRGPQHSHAWCDEVAKWDMAGERALHTWDNLMMGLRLGDDPRTLATTTPRAVPLLRRIMDRETCGDVHLTHGSTYDNAANLPSRFVRDMQRSFGKSALGRQELDGELLADIEGALWSRSLLERCRKSATSDALTRIVVGVDPPASARGDECGIVVCGLTEAGSGIVLADCSIARPSPERWANAVANAAASWHADRVVAEANQGGAMVESVLRAADRALPVKLVHASRGKSARAEPVAALYEAGRVTHGGTFPALEDQLCGLMAGGEYHGPGRSPDRADALVWALTELMLKPLGAPRVRNV